jgi:hypothetical protein
MENQTAASLKEVKRAFDRFAKGIVAFSKEVLPEDTERFAKMAAEPLDQIREVAATLKDALDGKKPGALLKIREECRKKRTLSGADAQALEHALTITERERDTAISKFQSHNRQLRKLLSQGANIDVKALMALIKKAP